MNLEKKSDDRYIYVVFMVTTTKVGKVIRTMTKHRYNHASLSLYPDLRVLYTFARQHKNTPFYGGFIKESLRRFPRDSRTILKVCRLRLHAEQYQKLCDFIHPFLSHPNEYVYNLLSAATHISHRRFKLSKSYTCIEFVTDALAASGYISNVPKFCSIENLEEMLEADVIYEGTVLGYPLPKSWEGDHYPQRLNSLRAVQHTASNVGKLLYMAGNEKILHR